MIFGKKVALDLLLVEKRIPGQLGCIGTYGVQTHKEHTKKLSSLYIQKKIDR